ncbi:MAG: AzlD domain-containing protein [Sphaerochaetaceae bacterium]|nr:AzlD domain-containing protein [Sphaerochaetaceae bacterium]
MSLTYLFLAIIIASAITLATRAFPFLLLSHRQEVPEWLLFVAKRLPVAVIAILVLYSIRHISFDSLTNWAGEAVSIAVVVLVHLYRRNTLASVLLGTLCYMTFKSLFG